MMRLRLVGCFLFLIFAVVLAETTEETTKKNQEEDEYEDIAVAESQDIAHSHHHPNIESDDSIDRPRYRPRGRKRRRRLRKRPRSTTLAPLFEDYSPETTVKEEEIPPADEEVVYQRRRTSKRRRRPNRRKPDYEVEVEPETVHDAHSEIPSQEYPRTRNPQRRRRKGNRKRIRVTTEFGYELENNTNEENIKDMTTHTPEVVLSNNNQSEQVNLHEYSLLNLQDEIMTSTLTPAFTPKEITEINHKLESLSESKLPAESDSNLSVLGGFNIFGPKTSGSETYNKEDNNIISSSSTTTTKDYKWITKFNPEVRSTIENEETSTPDTITYKVRDTEDNISDIKKEAQPNIKNIEKIIENRKSLFSTSKRLPPTSAVIRRRLRPRKHRNSTTTQETITDNTIPTTNPAELKTNKKSCENDECLLNPSSKLSNIIPSALLPSGYPTMPEIISTAELLQKISQTPSINKTTTQFEQNNSEIQDHASSNLVIITPSTLIRSSNDAENGLSVIKSSEIRILSEIIDPDQIQTDIFTTMKEEETKQEETTTSVITETTPTATKITTTNTEPPISLDSTVNIQSNTQEVEEALRNKTNEDRSYEAEKFKLDGVDVSNINDEILELIMDEMGKARVKRILELRNMTLSDLIAHRERGSGHFSAFIQENESKYQTESSGNEKTLEEDDSLTSETNIEERTEKISIKYAKHLMNEYINAKDSSFSTKSSKKENLQFGERMKVEGTVIPVPILEPTHTSTIQFPEDTVLGDFPKYMFDIAGKRSKTNMPFSNEKPSLYTESINKPRDIKEFNDKREPRVFESMPKFNSETSNKENLEISPYPDWRVTISKSTEKNEGFPGISEEIMLVATSSKKSTDFDDVILLDEGEDMHHPRNHILGGNMNIGESKDVDDEDYPEEKKVPAAVKSAIVASGALLGLAIFGFLAVLVSCKIRQRRARLRARKDILCKHLAEDLHSSQRSLTPVLRKSPFNHGIHSNTASSRHYYLWQTLRKTFQYE